MILKVFLSQNKRSNRAIKSILNTSLIKGLSILISFLQIRFAYDFLDPSRYGIWVLLGTFINMFGFFDIGLGNGLRNRFGEALANNDDFLAKKYVSTTYALVFFISVFLFFSFSIANIFINWNFLLNSPSDTILNSELRSLSLILFFCFSVRFVSSLITVILTADQYPDRVSFFDLIGKILTLGLIFILSKTQSASLTSFVIIAGGTPVIVLIITNFYYFKGIYKKYSPSISSIDLKMYKGLLNVGLEFFFIQISFILLYQSNSFIIAHLLGPIEVAHYNIAFTYFNFIMLLFSIVVTPFWSAFTEAWNKNDLFWIKETIKKLKLFWLLLIILSVIMTLFSKSFFKIWLSKDIAINYIVSSLICVWLLITAWNGIYTQFLSGISKLKSQLYITVFTATLNIPLSFYLGKYWGIEGVLLSNIFLSLLGFIIYPLEYKKLIKT
jgi:O-antigen/teichoic acid export membrane protein